MVPSTLRAIAYGNFRRLDRSAKRGAERPSFHNKWLIVERRSLHSGRSLPRAKSRGPSVETTGVAICDSSAREGKVSPSYGDGGVGSRRYDEGTSPCRTPARGRKLIRLARTF